ncbi:MAG: hypothetical protein NC209_00140 [Alistipes sp.]|nr:hypothetical protein [Alistipes senegalensis]MCM1249541.1 hypothetical protein [Alistipes sp.]
MAGNPQLLQRPPSRLFGRWRRNASDPEKAARNRRRLYGLLTLWSAATIGWTILILLKSISFNWAGTIVLAIGYINLALGIANCKRIISGTKPR